MAKRMLRPSGLERIRSTLPDLRADMMTSRAPPNGMSVLSSAEKKTFVGTSLPPINRPVQKKTPELMQVQEALPYKRMCFSEGLRKEALARTLKLL